MKPNPILVAIADDHDLIRSGLTSIVETFGNYTVSIEASNGLELIAKLTSQKVLPDVCIIDLQMAPLNGYETMLVLQKKWPGIKTIILSMHSNELLITKLLEAGAHSYLFKTCKPVVLNEAMIQVMKNGCYYTSEVAKMLSQKANKSFGHEITDKELMFLCLCCTELAYKEIADRMHVAERTVENYRESLFHKLGKHTRTGLALYASSSGLINLSTDYLSKSGILDKASVIAKT